jgi:hypothetical protein
MRILIKRSDKTTWVGTCRRRILLNLIDVEAMDLDELIFTPVLWWASTIVVYDNDLEYAWS